MAPGADIDASGVTFTDDLLSELLNALRDPQNHPRLGIADFSDATFTKHAAFHGATFTGNAWFNRATFNESAWLDRVTFTREAIFNDATFTREAIFNDATFTKHAAFHGATFTGMAMFGGATFTESAVFGRATFTGDALFGDTAFTGNALFDATTFSAAAAFVGVTFAGPAAFAGATFAGEAEFSGVTFSSNASFGLSVVEGELVVEAIGDQVVAKSLRGRGRVSLRLRAAEVDLSDVVLAGPLNVHGLHHPIAGADEAAFGDEVGRVPPVRVLSLRGLDASSVTLTDVDLSKCRFVGLHRADQIVLDGQCTFAPGPGGRRRVLAEEHHWRATQTGRANQAKGRPHRKSRGWTRLPDGNGEVVGPARLEVLYRQLRKATEDAKNEPGAADFYYGEMEMRRAAATRRPERWLLTLYWAISGYGLRARRALAWLALLAAISMAGTTWFGFPHTAKDQQATGTMTTPTGQAPITLTIRQTEPVTHLNDRLETATEVTLNAVIFRNPDADLTTAGRYLNTTVRILGPILLGLTILAIRNQVKR